MKISEHTLNVLKNFSTINQGLYVRSHDESDGKLITMSVRKNVVGVAKIDDKFPTDFAIYDLNSFLNTLSLFQDPDLDFEKSDKYMVINESNGSESCIYHYASTNVIVYPEKEPKLPSAEIEFDLTQKQLNKLLKSSNIMNLADLTISKNEEGKIIASVSNKKDKTANQFSVEVGDYQGEEDFNMIFLTENLKMMAGDYHVKISSKGVSQFTNQDKGLTYYIALESNSQFG